MSWNKVVSAWDLFSHFAHFNKWLILPFNSDGQRCSRPKVCNRGRYHRCLVLSPFLSRWSSDVRRLMSAMERTIGRRLASFFWFWWWCCFSSVACTLFLSSSPNGEYNSWWSKTMSKGNKEKLLGFMFLGSIWNYCPVDLLVQRMSSFPIFQTGF